MEARKDRVEKKQHIAVAILLLIGTPYLVLCALRQNDVLTFIGTFANFLPFVGSLTLGNIVYVASALLQGALRAFAYSFLFGVCVCFYREQTRSSGFARLKRSFVFGLQAGCLVVPVALPYIAARTAGPLLANGLAP